MAPKKNAVGKMLLKNKFTNKNHKNNFFLISRTTKSNLVFQLAPMIPRQSS